MDETIRVTMIRTKDGTYKATIPFSLNGTSSILGVSGNTAEEALNKLAADIAKLLKKGANLDWQL